MVKWIKHSNWLDSLTKLSKSEKAAMLKLKTKKNYFYVNSMMLRFEQEPWRERIIGSSAFNWFEKLDYYFIECSKQAGKRSTRRTIRKQGTWKSRSIWKFMKKAFFFSLCLCPLTFLTGDEPFAWAVAITYEARFWILIRTRGVVGVSNSFTVCLFYWFKCWSYKSLVYLVLKPKL